MASVSLNMAAFNSARPTFGIGQQHHRKRQAPPPAIDKPVLLSTDVDSTLIAWNPATNLPDEVKLQRIKSLLKTFRPKVAVHINTGRGLTSMKQAARHLSGFPVDFLSVNNGEELYINRTGLPADQWIKALTQRDQEAGWQRRVFLKTGWDQKRYHHIFKDILKAEGFKPIDASRLEVSQFKNVTAHAKQLPNGETVVVHWYGDQPAYAVSGAVLSKNDQGKTIFKRTCTPAIRRFAGQLQTKILEKLGKSGVQAGATHHTVEMDSAHVPVYSIFPQGYSKATPVAEIVNRFMTHVKGVITAGDHHYNDTPMLSALRYRVSPNHTVRNYPVISGKNTILWSHVGSHPRVTRVEEGDLAPGIRRQLGRILNLNA